MVRSLLRFAIPPRRPATQPVPDLAIALVAAIILAGVLGVLPSVPLQVPLATVALAVAGTALLALKAPCLPEPGRLGPANRVTLARGVLALPLAALVLAPGALTGAVAWLPVVLAATVLVLDGLDGRVARRTGTSSAFGARFDMELDALVLLALCGLVWATDRAGAWVLMIGLLRYLFVAAGWLWPWLQAPLPPSMRRKTACVIPGVLLTLALAPVVPSLVAVAAAVVGLVVLVYSFGVDGVWLWSTRTR